MAHKKFTVLVTKEVEVEIYLPENLISEDTIREWREGLWDIDGVEDIAQYAARMVAEDMEHYSHDGLGTMKNLRDKPESEAVDRTVYFNELWQDISYDTKE